MLTPARSARVGRLLLTLPSHGRVDADLRTEKEQQDMLGEGTTHAWMYMLWVCIRSLAGGTIHLHRHLVDRAINDRAINDRATIRRAINDRATISSFQLITFMCMSAEFQVHMQSYDSIAHFDHEKKL
jgi:hypothetical protein